jgi:thioester reductase-like protein
MDIDTLIQKHTSDLPIPSRSSREQFTVAITGSTGNLGCHMLNDLIQHPRVAKVVCLNRASPGKEAQDDAFRRNKLKHDTSSESQNTMVLHYKIDLSDPFLGLTPAQYTTLHREVDVLIHNAWQLDFLRTVNAFEKTHIAGVRHIVDLAAGSCRDMRIIFISSIGAVAGTSIDTFSEVPETPAKPGILPGGNGYSQSKFVGERILEEAVSKSHVKSSIIRVGQIAGPTTEATGTWSTTDWFPRIMASAELLRTVPDQLGIYDTVDWLPIDTVSRVVMDIFESTVLHPSSDQDLSDQGPNVFHIINPHIVPWKKLAPDVASFLGKDVRLLSLADWIADVRAAVGAKGPGVVPVEALLSWLDGMMTGTKLPRLAVEKTMAVSPALASPGPVQSSWIGRWMMDWRL